MRLFTQEVFNQQIVGTTAVYSDPNFNALLGSAEKLIVQATVEYVSGTSDTITVSIDQCNDNRNFVAKGGTAMINGVAFDSSAVLATIGNDPGTTPNASFVRLKIALAGTGTVSARVRVIACGRAEQGGT